MAGIRPALWILLGTVLGVASTSTVSVMRAQPVQPAKGRIEVSALAGVVRQREAYFIKDSKSGACWIALFWSEQQSLAPAPKEACD